MPDMPEPEEMQAIRVAFLQRQIANPTKWKIYCQPKPVSSMTAMIEAAKVALVKHIFRHARTDRYILQLQKDLKQFKRAYTSADIERIRFQSTPALAIDVKNLRIALMSRGEVDIPMLPSQFRTGATLEDDGKIEICWSFVDTRPVSLGIAHKPFGSKVTVVTEYNTREIDQLIAWASSLEEWLDRRPLDSTTSAMRSKQ
jgi:hypothetical protein